MYQDHDLVVVVCPNCGHKFQKEFGWLKANIAFHCGVCDSRLKHDLSQLLRLFNEEPTNANREIILNLDQE